MRFAEEHITWSPEQWFRVIFSDEKKINLDGPDGSAYYFHDLRKEERFLTRRQMGGGSVMIWACIGHEEKGPIQFLPRRTDSNVYLSLLEQVSGQFDSLTGGRVIFQQDNAPIH